MSHEHSIADAKPCPICGGPHGQHSDNCGNNRPKDSPKDWPSLCPYCGGQFDTHSDNCPFGPKPKVADSCGYAESADPLTAEIGRLACAINRLADSVNNNNQWAIMCRLEKLENEIMSELTNFLNQQKSFNQQQGVAVDAIVASVAGLTEDVAELNATITKLQNSSGVVTPEDQGLINEAQTEGAALVGKLGAVATALGQLDAKTPPAVPPAPPA